MKPRHSGGKTRTYSLPVFRVRHFAVRHLQQTPQISRGIERVLLREVILTRSPFWTAIARSWWWIPSLRTPDAQITGDWSSCLSRRCKVASCIFMQPDDSRSYMIYNYAKYNALHVCQNVGIFEKGETILGHNWGTSPRTGSHPQMETLARM